MQHGQCKPSHEMKISHCAHLLLFPPYHEPPIFTVLYLVQISLQVRYVIILWRLRRVRYQCTIQRSLLRSTKSARTPYYLGLAPPALFRACVPVNPAHFLSTCDLDFFFVSVQVETNLIVYLQHGHLFPKTISHTGIPLQQDLQNLCDIEFHFVKLG